MKPDRAGSSRALPASRGRPRSAGAPPQGPAPQARPAHREGRGVCPPPASSLRAAAGHWCHSGPGGDVIQRGTLPRTLAALSSITQKPGRQTAHLLSAAPGGPRLGSVPGATRSVGPVLSRLPPLPSPEDQRTSQQTLREGSSARRRSLARPDTGDRGPHAPTTCRLGLPPPRSHDGRIHAEFGAVRATPTCPAAPSGMSQDLPWGLSPGTTWPL